VNLDLSNIELLTTTRTVRRRLDLRRPVAREAVLECVEMASQAPNASNAQRLTWVVVDDPEVRRRMADIYRSGLEIRAAQPRTPAGRPRSAVATAHQDRMMLSVTYLRDHLHEVPVLVVPTIRGRVDGAHVATQAALWGSVLPAVWSFMLALRTKGMGSAWTTVHLFREADMAELLGIPFGEVTQAGLFPVAYTIGTDFGRSFRDVSDGTVRWNRW
jgi:nitroreductase